MYNIVYNIAHRTNALCLVGLSETYWSSTGDRDSFCRVNVLCKILYKQNNYSGEYCPSYDDF